MSKVQALAQHKAKPAEKTSGEGKLRGVPVDLETAVANLHASPDVIIRVEDVPSDARLSAGDATSGLVTGEEGQDKSSVWSLKVSDLPGLHLLTTSTEPINYPLTIRVLKPDPDGYAYASTIAKFDILVTDAGGVSAFSGLSPDDRGASKSDAALSHLRGLIGKGRGKTDAKGKRGIDLDAPLAGPLPNEQRSTSVLQQLMEEEERRETERKRMADAEAEWRLHEERRLAEAREQWEAQAQGRIEAALAQAARAEEQRLAAAEAKLKDNVEHSLHALVCSGLAPLDAARAAIAKDWRTAAQLTGPTARHWAHTWRSTIIFLISAIDFAGLRCFGHAFEQFMMVWQR